MKHRFLRTVGWLFLSMTLLLQGYSASGEQLFATAEAHNKEAVASYLELLCGYGEVAVADDFYNICLPDDGEAFLEGTYTLDTLKDAVAAYENCEANVLYSFVDCGQDGVYELALRFESKEPSLYNWVGVIGHDGERLVLMHYYEDGYRTTSTLYQSGHLWIGGSMGAGAQGYSLYAFGKAGASELKFSYNEYQGIFATMVAYDLPGDADWQYTQQDALADSEMLLREYAANGEVKLAILGQSAQKDTLARENAFINALTERGARLITQEEMDSLCDLTAYAASEAVWRAWDGDFTTYPTDAYTSSADVTVAYAQESARENCMYFKADDSEYAMDVLLSARKAVTDFRVIPLQNTEANNTGRLSASAPAIFMLGTLTPDKPLVLRMSFPGDMPCMGVYFKDSNGDARAYAIDMSGRDGSLLLTELTVE